MAYGIIAIDSAGMYVRIHVQDGLETVFETPGEAAKHIAAHMLDIRRCGYNFPEPVRIDEQV